MDFEPTPEGAEAANLAETILADHCTPDRLRAIDAEDERFDPALWSALAESGLVALTVPEEHGGSALGLVELCSVLIEVGRTVAPVPFGTHAVTAMALAQFGSRRSTRGGFHRLRRVSRSSRLPCRRSAQYVPAEPVTHAENDGSHWLLTGNKAVVPAGTQAGLFVVPAGTAEGADGVPGARRRPRCERRTPEAE